MREVSVLARIFKRLLSQRGSIIDSGQLAGFIPPVLCRAINVLVIAMYYTAIFLGELISI